MALKFDENGLIPAIVQDFYTKQVLTLAYMNEESLAISLAERRAAFGRAAGGGFGARARKAVMCSIL